MKEVVGIASRAHTKHTEKAGKLMAGKVSVSSLLFNHPSPLLLTFSNSGEAAKSQMVLGLAGTRIKQGSQYL